MKTKLLILMSLLLICSGLFVGCKDSVEPTSENQTLKKPSSESVNFHYPRIYEPPLSPGAPGFPTGDGGDGTGRGGSGGGGGGGGGSSSSDPGRGSENVLFMKVDYNNISVGQMSPCMRNPLVDILNTIRDIDGNLDAVLTKFNNNGGTFNYSFRKTNSANMQNRYLQSPNTPAFTGLTTNGDWITYLNEDILLGSSQEYLASVVLHEIYHIKLYIDNKNDYQNHSLYFSKDYVTNIKNDLLRLFGSSTFDSNAALGLALGGVTDGGNPSSYGMTLQDIKAIVGSYQTKQKGTSKCSD